MSDLKTLEAEHQETKKRLENVENEIGGGFQLAVEDLIKTFSAFCEAKIEAHQEQIEKLNRPKRN